MKKVLILAVAIAMVFGLASAQDIVPAAKAGAKSFNFTFNGLGTFGIGPSGINDGLGLSYFMSNDAALRLGLQLKLTSSTTPWNDNSGNGSNPGSDGSASTFGLGLGADYLMYVSGMSPRVKPYMGAGVFVMLNSSDTKFGVANNAANGTETEEKNRNGNEGLSFGVAGIAGAEFFIYNELSLSAEYQLNVISLTSRADKVVSTKGHSDVTTKQGSAMQILGFGTVGATLHIYM
jgi:opacity protein-like surface antigen